MVSKEAAKKSTIAICTSVKFKPEPRDVCVYWSHNNKVTVSGKTCEECGMECWAKCGGKNCPCSDVNVVNPPYSSVFDITIPGQYIVLTNRKYVLDHFKLVVF